jgi:hypothetical protein
VRAGKPNGAGSVVRRVLRAVFLPLAAAILLIEEWGWRPLSALAARLARFLPFARLEALIRRAPPRLAIVLFLVPATLLFPVKLLALWLIEGGRAALGVVLIVATKIMGTAIVGRLFVLLEPQLMQFAWFARALGAWHGVKERIRAAVHRSRAWRAARVAAKAARDGLRAARIRLRRVFR